MQWSMKKTQRKKNLSKLQKMKLRTHTHIFPIGDRFSRSISFHKATLLFLYVSLSLLLLTYPPLPLFRSQFRSFSAHFFMTLFRCCESLTHASNKHGYLALFRSMYRLFSCWFFFCLFVCLFVLYFISTHFASFSLALSFDIDAPKRYTCLASSKKKLFSHRLLLSLRPLLLYAEYAIVIVLSVFDMYTYV